MEHSEIKRLISPYLDGELDPSEAKAVEEHLGQCAECRADLESLRGLDQAVQVTGLEAPPEGYFEFFPTKLRARIRAERRGASSFQRVEARLARVRVGATTLVVLIAFGIGVIYGQRGLPIRSPRLTPIPVASEKPVAGSALLYRDSADVLEEETAGSTGIVGTRAGEELLAEPEKSEVREKGAEPGELPSDEVAGELVVPRRSYDEISPVLDEDAEGDVRLRTAPASLETAKEKKRAGVPEEAYAFANLAQLQQDYDKALDGYEVVVESSPGTELAAGAQFQINVMKAGVDTSDATETLRESARVWEEYIESYPKSDLVATACDFYTQALYSIAQKTQAKPDVENAIRAIEDCSSRLKDRSPAGLQDRLKELRKHLDG